MQGEPVPTATLAVSGIVGDRSWGITDPTTGRVLSAKTVPQLLEATATTIDDTVQIGLPDGTDRPVTLRAAASTDRDTRYPDDLRDPPNDDADLVDIPTPPSTLFYLAAIHLLTTTSLAILADAHPTGAWAPGGQPHRASPR